MESREFLKSDTLPQAIQRSFNSLRHDLKFMDFTIIVDGTRFRAHKLILAASSDFFAAMLRHASIESQNNECHLHDVTPAAMETILHFCYTSTFWVDIENVEEILLAASILQVNAIMPVCVEYMKKWMDTSNCLRFLILADRCNLTSLVEGALKWCLTEFDAISDQEEFLQLDANLLTKIISHDHLFASNEERVLSVVQKWIAANKETRIRELDNLAPHIRFPLMSPPSLTVLSKDDQIRRSKKCQELIREANDYHSWKSYLKGLLASQIASKRFEQRLRLKHYIYALGSDFKPDAGPVIGTVEKYDPYINEWVEIKKMPKPGVLWNVPVPSFGAGVAIVDDCLYVVGGATNDRPGLAGVMCYNIKEDFWHRVAPMRFPRYNLSVCAWDGHIYSIGGRDETRISSDFVERYDPRTDKWENCACLNQGRFGAGVAVCNNSIYVVGGCKSGLAGINQKNLKTVERFDVSKNEWSFVAPMTTNRDYHGCAAFEGKIYAVGGCDGVRHLDTAECYDPIEDRWEPIPSMSARRCSLALVQANGLLYAVGGKKDSERLKLVEAYDPVRKVWTTKCPMNYERLCPAVASYAPQTRQRPSSAMRSSIEKPMSPWWKYLLQIFKKES